MSCVAFRVDASSQIGTGHLMRCLTLADELLRRGTRSIFICREHPGNQNIYIAEERGFQVNPLPVSLSSESLAETNHAAWLGATWEEDALQTQQILESIDGRVDWLVVDHYALDARWEQAVAPYVGGVMAIDDLADRPHASRILLDQNYDGPMSETRYQGLVANDCRLLLGPRFALLRPEYRQFRQSLRAFQKATQRLLVFFGGADLTNETLKALQALAPIADQFEIDVVIGGANPHGAAIKEFCRKIPSCQVHVQLPHLASLMSKADLFIGAGGTTHWERCCLGIPSIVITIAENQEPATRALAEAGYLLYLGRHLEVEESDIRKAVELLAQNPYLRLAMRNASLQLVDGSGVVRVASQLVADLVLRPATLDDCEQIFQWRNADETRLHIFDPEPIPWEQHVQWYSKSINNPNRIILIGCNEDKPVGVLRYDLQGRQAVISIYLVPGYHGQGFGPRLISVGTQWLEKHCPEITTIRAEILAANSPSKTAFLQAGYREHHVTYEKAINNE